MSEKYHIARGEEKFGPYTKPQIEEYLAEQLPRQVLALLQASKDAPSYGYAINNYEHCVQVATLLHQDNYDEETIVTGLLHDVGAVSPGNSGYHREARGGVRLQKAAALKLSNTDT